MRWRMFNLECRIYFRIRTLNPLSKIRDSTFKIPDSIFAIRIPTFQIRDSTLEISCHDL